MGTNLTKSSRKLARRGQHDVGQVERIAVEAARRAMVRIRQAAIRGFIAHEEINVRELVTRELAPVLAKASAVMHALGQRRSLLMMKQLLTKAQRDELRDEIRWPWTGDVIELDLYSTVQKLVKKTLNVNIGIVQQQYGAEVASVLESFAEKAERKLNKKVGELIVAGRPTRDAVEELRELLDDMGASGVSDTQLETVFRTQLQTAFNAGRWQADQDPNVQEILWGYKYVTAGDDRVRESHAAWDGVTLPKDHEFWQTHWPPNGWNCRCQVIPIFDERDEVEPEESYEPDEGFSGNPGALFTLSLAFDPNQPRDPDGKWTSGGGGGVLPATKKPAPIHSGFKNASLDKKMSLLKQHVKAKLNPVQLKKVALLNDDPNKLVIPSSFTPEQVNAVRAAFGEDKPVQYVVASKALAGKMKELGVTSAHELWHGKSVTKAEKEIAVKEAKTPAEKLHAKKLSVAAPAPATFVPSDGYADKNFLRQPVHNGSVLDSDLEHKGSYSKSEALKAGKNISPEGLKRLDAWGMSSKSMRMLEISGKDDPKMKAFHEALDALPRYEGISYRGVKHISPGSEMYQALSTPGTTVELAASACSSRKIGVANEFANGVCILRIAGKSGACAEDYTGVKDEAEVVLRKGAKYRVVGVAHDVRVGTSKPNAVFIDLEEIKSDVTTKHKLALSWALELSNPAREERFVEDDPEEFLIVTWSRDELFNDEE